MFEHLKLRGIGPSFFWEGNFLQSFSIFPTVSFRKNYSRMRRYTGNEFIGNEINRIFVNNFPCHLLSSNLDISVTCNFHDFSSCLLRRLRDLLTARDGSRTAATSKMERFVIIVNGWKPLTVITKCSILNVAAVLDPPVSWLLIPLK